MAKNIQTDANTGQHDIWSLGILIYEIITGVLPPTVNKNNTISDILRAADLLATPIEAILEPDPKNRCNIDQVLQALDQYTPLELKTAPMVKNNQDAVVSIVLPTEVDEFVQAVTGFCISPTQQAADEIIAALTYFNINGSKADRYGIRQAIVQLDQDLTSMLQNMDVKIIGERYSARLATHENSLRGIVDRSEDELAISFQLQGMVFALGGGLAKVLQQQPNSPAYENMVNTLIMNILQPVLAIEAHNRQSFSNRFGKPSKTPLP